MINLFELSAKEIDKLIIDGEVDLKTLSKEELMKLVEAKKVTNRELTDSGICPTCFNRENGEILYGDNSDKVLFENDLFECFLVGNPRADGHAAISSKKHYKDMMDIEPILNKEIFAFAQFAMNTIRAVYGSESVYLCTMCDGPANHFHLQLIPRYSFEERGSDNFVKPRKPYVEDKEKIAKLREIFAGYKRSRCFIKRILNFLKNKKYRYQKHAVSLKIACFYVSIFT